MLCVFSYRVKEDTPGSCLDERAAKIRTFQELGPPDLVSLTKVLPGGKTPEVCVLMLMIVSCVLSLSSSLWMAF